MEARGVKRLSALFFAELLATEAQRHGEERRLHKVVLIPEQSSRILRSAGAAREPAAQGMISSMLLRRG